MDAPFALAFAAGLVASVNPCGFAMLPAYLSFLMGTGDTGQSRAAAVARALRVGLTVSAGFLVVFGLAGVALTAGARWLTTAIPFAALAVGIVLAVVGAFMLTGRTVPVRLPTVARAAFGTGNRARAVRGLLRRRWATVLVPDDRGRAGAGGVLTTGVETLSSRLTTVIGARLLLSAAVLLGVIGAAAGYVWRNRPQSESTDPPVQVSQTPPRDTRAPEGVAPPE